MAMSYKELSGFWTLHTPSHIGIVAQDLDKAQKEFGNVLEYDWVTTHDAVVPVRHGDGAIKDVRIQTRWSTSGLSHVELIQAVPGTVWASDVECEIHHIGYWVDDLVSASARLSQLGMPLQATLHSSSTSPTLFAYHGRPGSLRIEITDGRRRGKLQELIATVAEAKPIRTAGLGAIPIIG